MCKVCDLSFKLPKWRLAAVGLMVVLAAPSLLSAQSTSPDDVSVRFRNLERQLAELNAAAGKAAATQVAAAQAGQRGAPAQTPAAGEHVMTPGMVMPGGPVGGDPNNPEGAPKDSAEPKDLLDRIKLLEQRIKDLESSAVLSDPETRTRKKEVYVDKNGIETDSPAPGTKKVVTYERERVYRRQTINEKIEEAMADAEEHNVRVGVNAGIVSQFSHRTKGAPLVSNNHAYELASADLFFTAGIAQNTTFFADVVGLSGPPPDLEVGTLTLANGYSARLVNQNELNVREAWLRTELFSNRLGITVGRLDLTNYFDHNVAANDETSQFISDALVNNPALGLAINGAGLAMVYDPKGGFNFKAGFQQSDTTATNLSQSIYSLAEVGYVTRVPGMGEGNYRFWYRTDNSKGTGYNIGFGTSLDQKIGPRVTLFGRYGESQAAVRRDHFVSGGLQFAQGLAFYPGDVWGLGYSHLDLQIPILDPLTSLPVTGVTKERLIEGYYNFHLAEKFSLSFHVQHFIDKTPGSPDRGYLVPGIRLQASF